MGIARIILVIPFLFESMNKMNLGTLILVFALWSCGDGLPTPDDNNQTGNEVVIEPFENIPELNKMVIYEVNLRAFSNSGTINGLIKDLDHIQDLGVNVVWIMPLYPIGTVNTVNSPYCIRDYEDVNSEFGTLDDLKKLVNEVHKRDMAVILDWVANHTAWDHPWITSHADWYVKDANGDIIAPPGTGWTDVAELNYANDKMREEMISSMKFWVNEAGIDGFRCDAVDLIPTDFWTEAIADINTTTDKKLIWLAEGGVASNFTAGFQMNYSWDFYGQIKSIFNENKAASSIFTTNTQEYNVVPSNKAKLRYITNHDVYAWDETPNDVFSDGQVGAFVATAFMPGIPLIYDGQEVGSSGLISFFDKNPIEWSQNPDILGQYQMIMSTRNGLDAVSEGELVTYSNNDAIMFKRVYNEEEVLVMVNTRDKNILVSLPEELKGTSWNNVISETKLNLGQDISLSSFEYLILVN